MLEYDRRGLYTGDLLQKSDLPDQQGLEKAIDDLQDRFDSGELGFADLPDTDPEPITRWAEQKLREEWTDQVVIGIGGSSLGVRAILKSARSENLRGLRTHFAENLDPETVDRLFASLDPKTTLVVVITKSGTTIETMSQFWIAREIIEKAVGAAEAGRHFVAITDPERGELRKMVDQYGWDDFEVPPNVGGRFSVLTAVGLVPLALAGYPIKELLSGARKARDQSKTRTEAVNFWGICAAEHVALADKGFDQLVMMTYSDRLEGLVDWFAQLWGESLGKAVNRKGEKVHVGITPIKAVGVIDQHSQVQLYMEGPKNKHISFLEVQSFDRDRKIPSSPPMPEALQHLQGKDLSEIFAAELEGTRSALRDAGRPTSSWRFQRIDAESVGAFLFSWQMITAVAGELLDINAFDQPGVELGKKIAHGLLGRQDHADLADKVRASEGGDGQWRWSIK